MGIMEPLSAKECDEILKNNDEATNIKYRTYQVIPKDDTYKDLCNSIIYIVKIFHKHSILHGNIIESELKTIFDSSKKILQIAINLICDGQIDAIFNFAIDMEFNKAVYQNPPITSLELEELILAKDLINYVRINDTDSIYALISYVSSDFTRNELMPTLDWFNMPI